MERGRGDYAQAGTKITVILTRGEGDGFAQEKQIRENREMSPFINKSRKLAPSGKNSTGEKKKWTHFEACGESCQAQTWAISDKTKGLSYKKIAG